MLIIEQNNFIWNKISENVQYCCIKKVTLIVNTLNRKKFVPIKIFDCLLSRSNWFYYNPIPHEYKVEDILFAN